MERKSEYPLRIVLICMILFLMAVFLKDSTHQLKIEGREASREGTADFRSLSKWIPKDFDFYAVFDANRMLGIPMHANKFASLIGDKRDSVSLFDSLMEKRHGVSMIAIAGGMSAGDDGKIEIVAIIQGDFDESEFVKSVSDLIASEGGKIGSVFQEGRNVYYEEGEDDPYAFMFLDENHLMLGEMDNLSPAHDADDPIEDVNSDKTIFGVIDGPDVMAKMIPARLSYVKDISFYSDDGHEIVIAMDCGGLSNSMDARLFLEAARTFMLLRDEKGDFTDVLKDAEIYGDERNAYIKARLTFAGD